MIPVTALLQVRKLRLEVLDLGFLYPELHVSDSKSALPALISSPRPNPERRHAGVGLPGWAGAGQFWALGVGGHLHPRCQLPVCWEPACAGLCFYSGSKQRHFWNLSGRSLWADGLGLQGTNKDS